METQEKRTAAVKAAMKLHDFHGWKRFGAMAWHVCKFSFYAGMKFEKDYEKD